MKTATRAHTVSKFHLKGFVAPESECDKDPFVWLGCLPSGEIKRRSPKNISISPGLYDGPGGFDKTDSTIESHLSKIESEAAASIRQFVAIKSGNGMVVPQEIWRFLAWQATRTPGWIEVEDEWIYNWNPNVDVAVVEPPPEGINNTRIKLRTYCMENPDSGERCEAKNDHEFKDYCRRGWKWVRSSEDMLEGLHMQAWYFQVRHFPRLSWVRLDAPDDEWFIINDRGVAWLADGYADTPPAALRHPKALVVAPLTRKVVLIGRNETHKMQITPREVNRIIAFSASGWIAGPSKSVVEQAMRDRATSLQH